MIKNFIIKKITLPNNFPFFTSFACSTFEKVCSKAHSSGKKNKLCDVTNGNDSLLIPLPREENYKCENSYTMGALKCWSQYLFFLKVSVSLNKRQKKGCRMSAATLNQEKQAYQNVTCSTQDPDDRLAGSSQLSFLVTEVIEEEVGPLVQFDD